MEEQNEELNVPDEILPILNAAKSDQKLELGVDGTISSDVAVRILAARASALSDERYRLVEECSEKDIELYKLKAELKEAQNDKAKLKREVALKNRKIENLHKEIEETKSKNEDNLLALNSLKREIQDLKLKHTIVSDQKSVNVRVQKLTEEITNLKTELQQVRKNAKDVNKELRLKLDDASHENKNLEKQKAELLIMFKKQMQLIHVLKKQKMHLEAMKILEFTEEEFLNSLD